METIEQLYVCLDDDRLVNAVRLGDREAFASLVARDRALVYTYAYARLGNQQDAEDATQETFVHAFQSLGQLRKTVAWHAWLMRIARNACNDSIRRQRLRRTEPVDPAWTDNSPSPEAQLLVKERQRLLRMAVETLPQKYRVMVLLRYATGCTRREIAAALGLPESTVMGRISRAVRLLRRKLGEEVDR